MFFDKNELVIKSGWLEFYDSNKWYKEAILSFLEPLMVFVLFLSHVIFHFPFSGIITIYGLLYLYCRFDFISTVRFVLNYKNNQMIKTYVGDELYYFLKFNSETLTLSFPELIQLTDSENIMNVEKLERIKSILILCKEVWNSKK
jgi:hypothetical protein